MRQYTLDRPCLAVVLLTCVSCAGAATPEPATGPATATVPEPPPAPPPAVEPEPTGPEPCGAMGCLLYDSPAEAFAAVLKNEPLVLAVGETHAQVDGAEVSTTTSRFTEQLLPTLENKASDVVLELMQRSGDCVEKEKKVAKKQEPVKQTQKKSNQSEFLELGNRAKSLGIRPHILRPTCEDFDAVIAAGDGAVILMLEMIARLTSTMAKAILQRNQRQGNEKVVVTYTGIVHNDLVPREGREGWSFGPDLSSHVGGRYVEVDLIVPEFVKSGPPWDSLEWTQHFDKSQHPDKTKLYNPRPGSYVLVFPASAAKAAKAAKAESAR